MSVVQVLQMHDILVLYFIACVLVIAVLLAILSWLFKEDPRDRD